MLGACAGRDDAVQVREVVDWSWPQLLEHLFLPGRCDGRPTWGRVSRVNAQTPSRASCSFWPCGPRRSSPRKQGGAVPPRCRRAFVTASMRRPWTASQCGESSFTVLHRTKAPKGSTRCPRLQRGYRQDPARCLSGCFCESSRPEHESRDCISCGCAATSRMPAKKSKERPALLS